MASDWFVSPGALSRARLAQLLTQEELAKKSGVSVRSIRTYERREERVRLDTLQCLAKTLATEVRDIARLRARSGERAAGEAPPAPAQTAPAAPAAPDLSPLPPRTQLEALVDLERAAKIDPAPRTTARGPAEALTAKRLQDVLTAYALYEGRRFHLTGKVDAQRGIAPTEAQLLGSRGGIAARFHIVKEVVPGRPVGVTVHTAEKEHTTKLQALSGAAAALVVRVVLVPGEPRDDGPGFSSFITRLTTKRPWTFVVEEVGEAGADERGEAQAAVKRGRAKRKG